MTPSDLRDNASADNAVATATLSKSEATAQVRLTSVAAYFDDFTATGVATVKDGGTTVVEIPVPASGVVLSFDSPIIGGQDNDVTVELSASGTGGVVGHVSATGF